MHQPHPDDILAGLLRNGVWAGVVAVVGGAGGIDQSEGELAVQAGHVLCRDRHTHCCPDAACQDVWPSDGSSEPSAAVKSPQEQVLELGWEGDLPAPVSGG